jgi:uncharacterized protein YpiB (UPF0302 family)
MNKTHICFEKGFKEALIDSGINKSSFVNKEYTLREIAIIENIKFVAKIRLNSLEIILSECELHESAVKFYEKNKKEFEET